MKSLEELGISPAPWKRTGDWMVANADYDHLDGTTDATRVVMAQSGADARLIAAAPELYEALERVRSALSSIRENEREGATVFNKGFILDELVRTAASALAKAGGAE